MVKQVTFYVDGFRYVWSVSRENQVMFCLNESVYKTRMVPMEDLMIGWDDDDIIISFDETGVCRKPVELIRRVAAMTIEWIKTAKPQYFWFRTPTLKKMRIYKRLIERFGRNVLRGFQVVEYEDAIYFYRDITVAA